MPPLPFAQQDLALELLSHLNVVDAISYSRTSRANRNIVGSHMLIAVRKFVGPFFGTVAEYAQFWDVLTSTRSVLSGDLTLAIMQPLSQPRPRLDVLNIFVPTGSTGPIAAFFEGLGYEEQRSPLLLFKLTATCLWKQMRTFKKATHSIICFESIGCSVLPLILTGPCTAVMNALTATKIYMFYPTLTFNGHGVVGSHWPVHYFTDFYVKHGIQVLRG
ncbi:hypothetical protein FPV67DRAFT_1682685 [Lyophyllum atratum]|nr:hypothetical protein FPV67DRAFT_1682685 [Lyophyllum atratum]